MTFPCGDVVCPDHGVEFSPPLYDFGKFVFLWCLLRSNHLEADGVTETDRMIGRCGGEAEVPVKIELLVRRELVGCAKVYCVLRATALRKRS